MSADNWAKCPKCEADIFDAANIEEYSLREDYEFYLRKGNYRSIAYQEFLGYWVGR